MDCGGQGWLTRRSSRAAFELCSCRILCTPDGARTLVTFSTNLVDSSYVYKV